MDAAPVSASLDSHTRRQLLFWTVVAFVVRACFVLLEPATRPIADERTWLDWAGILLSDRVGLNPFRTAMVFHAPGYSYFLASVLGPFGSIVAVKWAQVVVSTAIVPALGLVGVRVFGGHVGVVAAGVVALYPELVWFSVHFWSETLFMAFLWWSIERLLAADARGSLGRAAVAGVLWGLATLTRETVLYLLPLAALWLVWQRRKQGGVRRAAVFFVLALATVAPWTYRNWVRHEAFIPVSTAGGLNLYQGNAPLTRQQVYDRYYAVKGRVDMYQWARREGIRAILDRQPWWLLEKLRDEMPRFWEADSLALIHIKRGAYGDVSPAAARLAWGVIAVPFLAALGAFLWGLASLRPDRCNVFLLVLLCSYNGLHLVTHGFARYRLPVLPVVLLFAAWTLSSALRGALPPLDRRRRLALGALVLAAVVTVSPSLRLNYQHPSFGFVSGGTPRP